MIVHMGAIDVRADDKGMIFLCKTPCELHTQAVGLFGSDLVGHKSLPYMVRDHIVFSAAPSGAGNVLLLGQCKFTVGHPAVALVAGDEPSAIRFLRIGYIVDGGTDGLFFFAPFADVQRHDARGCHKNPSIEKADSSAVREWITDDFSARLLCITQHGSGASPIIQYTGHQDVSCSCHPLIAFDDGIAKRHGFQRWVQGAVVSVGVLAGTEIGEHKDQTDLWVCFLLLPQYRSGKLIEHSASAEIKGIGALQNQVVNDCVKPCRYSLWVCDLRVTAESDDHNKSLLVKCLREELPKSWNLNLLV